MLEFDYRRPTNRLVLKTDDSNLFDQIREHFSVENDGARFARRYNRFAPTRKYVITGTGTCELGLYWEIRKFLIKEQINTDITISDNLQKALKVGLDVELCDHFNFKLRDYQEDVVGKALRLGRGTCVLGTGAGKTFITAALIENYFINSVDKDTFKCLMLVPDLGLVAQTYDEFVECGSTFKVTKWTGKHKPDLTANVIIANIGIIQSRFEDNDWLKYIDLLVVDECHRLKRGNKISKIVQKIKTHNKYGFTGTLPESQLDKWSIIGTLGPVVYEKSSYELRLEDHLTNVTVKILELNYTQRIKYVTQNRYREELDFVYENADRNNFLTKLCSKLPNNILLLVNRIKHGEALLEYLEKVEDKQVFFIRGEVAVEERERIKQIMEKHDNVVCIAISAIFSTGINIKNLHNIIFAAGGKSFIRTVQSIGRGLRKHKNKDKLIIMDVCDNLPYGKRHCEKRKTIYDKEKIMYKEVQVKPF